MTDEVQKTEGDMPSESKAEADSGDTPALPPEAGDEQEKPVSRIDHAESKIAVLNGEIEILTQKRLSALDRGKSLAYAARSKGDSSEMLFALVCEKQLIPRSGMAGKYAGILSPGLVTLVASGVAYWPPEKEERYIFVYQNTLGKPLMKTVKEGGLGWSQDRVMKGVIKPMVNILMDLRDKDMVHGCINPTNIYSVEGEEDRVILGECLATPPSFLQPRVFEPIYRAQTDNIAKGTGTFEDDLYAFGVTLTMLMRHKDPLAGLSNEEIVRKKIELGSYAALTGRDRFTGAVLELLRGLLYDDRDQRWTLDEIDAWLDGQRLSPKQSSKKLKASRPIHFNGERYFRPVLLAMDLGSNQTEAAQVIENGALEQWVERSLEDKMTFGRLEETLEQVKEGGRGPGYWDRLVARVCMALDPEAPIRFKGLSLHPEGVQYALAESYMMKNDLMPFVDLINDQLVMAWIAVQQEARIDIGNLVSKFDSCRAFLRQNTVGYGIERCLYFLCAECPCISERLKGFYVRNPEDMMYAFEKIAEQPKRPELFIDRHIAAFLSVKDRRMIDPFFNELNAAEYHKKIMGNIKVLATIQKRSRMENFPGIGSWVAGILEPVYKRYHDRELRDSMRKKVAKFARTGDIVKIVTLLDNNEVKQRDFINFKKAIKEFQELVLENEELKEKMENPEIFGTETGQDVAAIVSGLLAGVVILVFAFMHFTKAGVF